MNNILNNITLTKINRYSPFKTLMIREFWEHKRAIFYTPMFITGLFIIMSLIGIISTGELKIGDIQIGSDHTEEIPKGAINIVLLLCTGLIWIGVILAMIFTALGSLYDERKDSSVLFWKSMPVSDTQTVMSKILTVLFVIPLVAIPFAWIAQTFLLLIMSYFLSYTDINIWQSIWAPADFLSMTGFFLAYITTTAVWIAPLFAWFMLVSVTAKRAPFLTAIIIPAVTIATEALIFHTQHLGSWIGMHLTHGHLTESKVKHLLKSMERQNAFDITSISKFLFETVLSVDCAIGVVIAAAMTYVVIQIRKRNAI